MEFEHKHKQVIPQKCPVCEVSQEDLKSMPVGHSEDRMIMHVQCTKCNSAIMVFITQNDVGMMTFGVMVDVHDTEAGEMFSQNPINDDDVINVHRYLQKEGTNIHDFVEQQ